MRMNTYSLIDSFLYYLVRSLSMLLCALPVGAGLKLGSMFGDIAYLVNYKRARVAHANMRAAFCGDKDPLCITKDVKRLYRNVGMTLAEVLRTPRVDNAYVNKYIDIQNQHHFYGRRDKSKGLIFLTGHFGNWELSSISSAIAGLPLMVLAREQKMTRLNSALNSFRQSKGCKVVHKGMATREIFDHLSSGGAVGILSDQDAGKRGVFVNFFGRPTSSARGAFALSQKTGAAIIPTFMIRTKGAHHRLVLESPIEVASGDDGIRQAMQEFSSVLERYVRQYPEQWLWLHKRWKSTTLKKVAILNDGKAGHTNQSLGVFDSIKEIRRQAGYSDVDTQLLIIDIDFKTHLRRLLLSFFCSFLSGSAWLREKALAFSLTRESYTNATKTYADIVISCGAKTSAVNILFSAWNNSKRIVIMKPGIVPIASFNLAIIPMHDRPAKADNIVPTTGAPNLISENRLKAGLDSLNRMVYLEGKRCIGLFIGGENRHYMFDRRLMENVAEGVVAAARRLDMRILASTSRRTAADIAGLLKTKLSGSGLAKLVIDANERNPEWAVAGIMAASDVVVVSGESNSMLSEAAASGKRVIAFMPRKKKSFFGKNKHEAFVERLSSAGYVKISRPDDLENDIMEAAGSGRAARRLDDDKNISAALMRVI